MKEIQFILYNLPDDEGKVQAVIKDETIWLTQKAMAALFDVGVPAISKHLNNIYEEGELSKEATVSKMEIVQEEGTRTVKRSTDFYNLDAIISVGYRVNSVKATKFRQWATKILNDLKSATTRLYDTEAKIICIVSKKGAQCIECHHKDI